MTAQPTLFRLLAALVAVATTTGLLATVCAIAEPQRSVLMARSQPTDRLSAKVVTLAAASNAVAVRGPR